MPVRASSPPEPYAHGMLEVGDGHALYWEAHGNPAGKPAVVLHGGPGSGCGASWTGLFDLDLHRVILFDQRGCGRSRPHAAHDLAALEANTTQHLVADIERLRETLEIERWLLTGASWGSTLALAYAQAHPEAVSEVVLFSVVTTTRREVEWVTYESGRFFPEEWERFRAGAGAGPGAGERELAAAYHELLRNPDPAVHERAARAWCAWEDVHVRTHPSDPPDPRYEDPAFRLCFARLVTHYWRHAAWLADGQLLRGASAMTGIPAVLVHGRQDVSGPIDVPWRLARAWPGCELAIVEDEGHRSGMRMRAAVRAAIRGFAAEV